MNAEVSPLSEKLRAMKSEAVSSPVAPSGEVDGLMAHHVPDVFSEDGTGLVRVRQRPEAGAEIGHAPLRGDGGRLSELLLSLHRVDLVEMALTAGAMGRGGEPTLKSVRVLGIENLLSQLHQLGSGLEVFQGKPYIYDGASWRDVDIEDAKRFLGQALEKLGAPAVDCADYEFREKLLKQATTLSGRYSGAVRRNDTVLINFLNGTLEIGPDGDRLGAFCREDFLTYQLPFVYLPGAECPMFQRYLDRVLPDSERQRIVAEFIGWVFLPSLKLEKVLLLYGNGHNGKSVLFDVVSALLGCENITNFSLGTLAKMENRIELGGKLLNFGSEISGKIDADLFKKLASGEPVEARRLYQDATILRDYSRLAFNANTLPRDTEQTTGFFRRFLIVKFEETITEAEKDPDLARKVIAAELPGVFNWVMEGLRTVRRERRFSRCRSADEALESYRTESDTAAMFLREGGPSGNGFASDDDGRFPKDELYKSYREYCADSGSPPLSKRNFGERLRGIHGIRDGKIGGVRHWKLTERPE